MKWALGGVTLIAVIAVTAAVSIAMTKSSGGGNGTPTASGAPSTSASASGTTSNSDFASANDTGPVNIITEEPTCAAWTPINNTLAQAEKNGWDKRDPQIPASGWSADQRGQHEEVGRAMKDAADQTVRLAKVTPHRVMRELYEQFIAYARAYNDAIPRYEPINNYLAAVVGDTSTALVRICAAIAYGSAEARAPLVATEPQPPTRIAELGDPNSPTRFIVEPNSTCSEWDRLLHQFKDDTVAWQQIDPHLPASGWNSDERATIEAVIPKIQAFADSVEKLGRGSDNPTLEDFGVAAAQYRRAYAEALRSYGPADSYLSAAAVNLTSAIYDACKAAGS